MEPGGREPQSQVARSSGGSAQAPGAGPTLATTVLGVGRQEDPEQQGDLLALVHRLPGVDHVWMDGDELHVAHDPSLYSPEELVDALERRGFPLRLGVIRTSLTGQQIAMSSAAIAGLDPMLQGDLSDALLLIPYAVFVLTMSHQGELNACTASWLNQVSFEPPLLAAVVDKASHSHDLLQAGGTFAVNFLDSRDISLANRLALPHRLKPRNMAGELYHLTERGAPILDQAFAFLECQVRSALDPGGDHTIVVGEVVGGAVRREADILTLRESGLKYR